MDDATIQEWSVTLAGGCNMHVGELSHVLLVDEKLG